MNRYEIKSPAGLDALEAVDVDEPEIGPSDVLVEMKAWSLKYRDLAMPYGGYVRNDKVKKNPPLVPLSDGAGDVVAIGGAATRVTVGDRVAPIFFQDRIDDGLV